MVQAAGEVEFSTRERGREQPPVADVFSWNIAQLVPTIRAPNSINYFAHNLAHTLGFLNRVYGPRRLSGGGQPNAANPNNPDPYIGDPQRPFPWLTWNDRPFANHMELMLVPASSPSRLLIEFTTITSENPYLADGRDVANLRAPFEHLLNFFHSSRVPRATTAPTQQPTSPNLHRLFELVEVPSRFVGTERCYNPSAFGEPNPTVVDPSSPSYTFRPPFNKLSRFRDPGRININTIFDVRVWQAIAHGFPAKSTLTFWEILRRSRRGYDSPEQDRFPTEFANPFRSAMGADLQFELMAFNEPLHHVDATLLRSDPRDNTEPLFQYESSQLYDNPRQNPYFRYQFLRRLGNIVTTRSNVFAVWITMGFFEMEDRLNPTTGLRELVLGQELNLDTGDVTRHRSFYIIDRSIPVAFEAGENHNVDRAILLRRHIE